MLPLDCLKLQMEGKYLMRTFNALPCGGRGFSKCLVFKGFLTLICEGLIFKKKRCVVLTKRKIVTFFIVAIGIPLLIDWMIFANRFPSSISNEAWAGFLGSYIGGLCTLAAVFITIEDNNKKISEQRRTQEIQEKEQRRLNIRPYLDTRYKYFDQHIVINPSDRIFEIENETTKMLRFALTEIDKNRIELQNKREYSREMYINYMIRNVGAGSAVNMRVYVNGFGEELAIAKDECVQLLCMVTIKDDMPSDLKIRLDFGDVESRGRYRKEDTIHIKVDKDNELVSRITREEQKLIDQ